MKKVTATMLITPFLMAVCTPAAAQADLPTGMFVGLSAGGSSMETGSIGLVTTEDTGHGNGAGKISLGYWFSKSWGVETSYVPMGQFEQTYGASTFRGKVDSFAVSFLGRLPINDRWSVVGKITLAQNRVKEQSSTAGVPEFSQLRGSSTNLVLPGLEVNYRFNDAVSFLFEVDPRGSAADKVDVGYAGFGLRYYF